MDATFREILKKQIQPEILDKSYETFRNNFVKNHPTFDNEYIVSQKVNFLLEFIFKYENRFIINGIMADQIFIYTDPLFDIINELYVGIYDTNTNDEVFGCNIYTNHYYKLKTSFDTDKIIFKNDEFVIIQHHHDDVYDVYDVYDGYDDYDYESFDGYDGYDN